MNEQMMQKFYKSFLWLQGHPAMEYAGLARKTARKSFFTESAFPNNLDIEVVKVNPDTETIEDDDSLNTAVRVWIECIVYYDIESKGYIDVKSGEHEESNHWKIRGMPSHDFDLDTGGKSYEEAIINLAQEVYNKYGDYEHNGYHFENAQYMRELDSKMESLKQRRLSLENLDET